MAPTAPTAPVARPTAAIAKPTTATAPGPERKGTGTAPLPAAAVVIPPPSPTATANVGLTREPARDTLAPSSFGVLGTNKPPTAPAPAAVRGARAPLPTLGDLEGATATATLRPPGAVPPPPRALPLPTPSLDAVGLDRDSELDRPVYGTPGPGGDVPSTPLAGDVPPSPKTPQPRVEPARSAEPARGFESATVVSAGAAPPFQSKPAAETTLDSTLDVASSASKKATQAALIEQTRISEGGARPSTPSAVPAPGLFIADEPLERRPKQSSLVTVRRDSLSRMRIGVLVLGGLLLMAAGALVVMVFRRSEASANRNAAPSASAAPTPPGCLLSPPPSRLSAIERSVPISALAQDDGSIALGIADAKDSAVGWIYDPIAGEPKRKLDVQAGSGDVSHVTATDPLLVDRGGPDFAFGQTLGPSLQLGVGPSGILRRGADGATGVVWPLPAGVRVTPPRAATLASGYFVAFRQGGADGQIMAGWVRPDGSAAAEPSAVEGAPKSLGTPNVAVFGEQALVMFSGRADKSEPYRIYVAAAAPGKLAGPARAIELPTEGGGAIAPSLAALVGQRYLVQWTDGNVGQYQVHVRLFDAELKPLSEPLLVSAKGANAGQGTIVTTAKASVSFFIQTTAGHDELWGVALSCH